MKRVITLNPEKGARSWLTTTPSKYFGFVLNKQEFKDSIHLQYKWRIPNTASHYAFGDRNSIDHSLSCKIGRVCPYEAQPSEKLKSRVYEGRLPYS